MNINFENIGFYQTKLSEIELLPLNYEIKQLESNFKNPMSVTMNTQLAGHIAREYSLSATSQEHIDTILSPHISSYIESNKKFFGNTKPALHTSWVNFQKTGEFNPPHNHTGIISFVIWLKIPYNIEDEFNNNFVKYSNTPLAGCFSFLYNTSLGNITQHIIKAGNDFENTLLIFPAHLNHCVYPFFTTNNYRISIAGNYIE